MIVFGGCNEQPPPLNWRRVHALLNLRSLFVLFLAKQSQPLLPSWPLGAFFCLFDRFAVEVRTLCTASNTRRMLEKKKQKKKVVIQAQKHNSNNSKQHQQLLCDKVTHARTHVLYTTLCLNAHTQTQTLYCRRLNLITDHNQSLYSQHRNHQISLSVVCFCLFCNLV